MNGNEKARILNMLRDGAITTEEAERLLDALEGRKDESAPPPVEPIVMKDPRGRKAKKLRIQVDNGDRGKNKAKVNVSIPVSLIRSLGPIALNSIPKDTKRELEEKGIDIEAIFSQVEEMIESGVEEDFVNIDTDGSDDNGASKVRIYVE